MALGSLACKSDYPTSGKAASPESKAQPRQVKTVKVAEMPIGQTVTVNGTLAAYDHTTLSLKVPGRLQTISIDLGSVVHKGQVIAQVEQQDYKLRVQQSEAALAQARARLGLSPDGADDRVTAEETGTVRQAKAVLEDAKLKRERATKLLQQGVIPHAEWDTVETVVFAHELDPQVAGRQIEVAYQAGDAAQQSSRIPVQVDRSRVSDGGENSARA